MNSTLRNRLHKLSDLAKAKQEAEPGMDLSLLSVAELLEMRALVEKVEVLQTELTVEEKERLARLCGWCVIRQGDYPLTRAEALKAAQEAEESGEV